MAYSIGALNAKKPKLKKGNFKKKLRTVVSEHFNDYFINTTLHGLKYVGQTYLHIIERLFFAISFILVVCLSGYFITNVYMKWVNTPIIISLDPQLSQSKDFPFPAVTVCNMNQAKESVAKIIPKRSKEHSVLTSLCYHKKFNSTVDSTIFGTWAFVRRFIVNISQPCTELLMACKFSGEDVLCDDIFQSILTDEGLCCTFNSLDAAFMFRTYNDQNNFDIVNERKTKSSVYWSPETGVRSKNFSKSPRRNPGAGTHMGLSLMLNVDLDEYFCSSTNSYGFKILLHSPAETPKISNYGIFISPGSESRIQFSPIWYSASTSIQNIDKKIRQCLFENESTLEFFSVYTKHNCEMECEASITEAECGCRALHMPKLNEDVRICDQRDSECYERIKFQTEYFGDESLLCECLPACYEIGYETELSSAPLLSNDMVPDEQRRLYVRNNTAILHVYLKDTSFRSFTKTEFIGFTEFLSNTGGLLGLFLGFSVLSVMEIIYFVSMRPYCLTKKEKQLARKARKIKKNFLQANLNQGNHNEQIKNAWVGNKKSRKIGVLPYVE